MDDEEAKTENFTVHTIRTVDMLKFWAIGTVFLLITVFLGCIVFFGFVASTFG